MRLRHWHSALTLPSQISSPPSAITLLPGTCLKVPGIAQVHSAIHAVLQAIRGAAMYSLLFDCRQAGPRPLHGDDWSGHA